MMDFPLPNDRIGGYIVIASVSAIADERGETATVLLLAPKPPYFAVGEYAISDFDPALSGDAFLRTGFVRPAGNIDIYGTFENIVPAVREYEQNGGDY